MGGHAQSPTEVRPGASFPQQALTVRSRRTTERGLAPTGSLAVRGHDPASILATLRSRVANDPEVERHIALEQIGLIAGYRLADVVSITAGVEDLAAGPPP